MGEVNSARTRTNLITMADDSGSGRGLGSDMSSRAVCGLLKEMGVETYARGVVDQVLEFVNLYVKGLVETAQDYATHAGRKAEDITQGDIALATGKSKGPQVDPLGIFEPVIPTGFPAKPNQHLLKLVAERINAKELPKLSKRVGLALPGDESCLTAQNFEIP